MTRAEKAEAVKRLTAKFKNNSFFYLTDSSALTVQQVNKLRGLCFDRGVEMKVVKNTLAVKALESFASDKGFDKLYESLKGPTAIMFADNASAPAKIIKEFREDHEKPALKAAYIDTDVFVGDDQVDQLASLKSKEELIAEVIYLLESPIKGLLGSLESGGATLSGLLTTLEERAE
ncbi:MAG: 50S ribosomal protein L10 [Saprospiraceae bacterium]|nr:50S ribosomal protein L10 [Saprospiraceae bacterium]